MSRQAGLSRRMSKDTVMPNQPNTERNERRRRQSYENEYERYDDERKRQIREREERERIEGLFRERSGEEYPSIAGQADWAPSPEAFGGAMSGEEDRDNARQYEWVQWGRRESSGDREDPYGWSDLDVSDYERQPIFDRSGKLLVDPFGRAGVYGARFGRQHEGYYVTDEPRQDELLGSFADEGVYPAKWDARPAPPNQPPFDPLHADPVGGYFRGTGGFDNYRTQDAPDRLQIERGRGGMSEFAKRHTGQGSGRGRYYGVGPKSYTRSDDRIGREIHHLLVADGDLDASDVEVQVENGEVILRGHVASRDMKYHVEDIVDEVVGVREIQNQIRVGR